MERIGGGGGGGRDVCGSAAARASLPTVTLGRARLGGDGLPLRDLVAELGLAPSKKAARRLLESRGVRLDGEIVEDAQTRLTAADFAGETAERVLSAGKKKHGIVRMEGG